MDQPRFVIQASEAESMAQSSNLTLPQLLPSLVRSSQPLARAPISNFHVAAVGIGASGCVFVGVNLEFPDLPFHHTEQFLLTNLNAETQLKWLAVSADGLCLNLQIWQWKGKGKGKEAFCCEVHRFWVSIDGSQIRVRELFLFIFFIFSLSVIWGKIGLGVAVIGTSSAVGEMMVIGRDGVDF